MKRTAVIPVWNGRDLLAGLLRTLRAQTLPFDELIVVDNGSGDGAGTLAAECGAHVVRFPENRGFCVAVNQGVQASSGDLIAILNSDVELSPTWAEVLVRSLESSAAWFAAGLLLAHSDPSSIDGTWDLVSMAGMPWRAGNGAQANHPAFHDKHQIELASFTAILLRRELWNRVGPLDERFETYLEDVDFGLRCAAVGHGGVYEPSAIAWHKGSATLGRWNPETVRRMSRNQVFLVCKHMSPDFRRKWWWKLLVGQALWGLVALGHGAGAAWFRGKRDGLRRGAELQAGIFTWLGAEFFAAQEREILRLQGETGFDRYWAWYRTLSAGREAK